LSYDISSTLGCRPVQIMAVVWDPSAKSPQTETSKEANNKGNFSEKMPECNGNLKSGSTANHCAVVESDILEACAGTAANTVAESTAKIDDAEEANSERDIAMTTYDKGSEANAVAVNVEADKMQVEQPKKKSVGWKDLYDLCADKLTSVGATEMKSDGIDACVERNEDSEDEDSDDIDRISTLQIIRQSLSDPFGFGYSVVDLIRNNSRGQPEPDDEWVSSDEWDFVYNFELWHEKTLQ
jgi:hypothetical protein